MVWRRNYCLGLLFATALCIPAAWSQTAPAPVSPAVQFLLTMMRKDITLEMYMKAANERFLQLDADGDGQITGADDDLRQLIVASSMRAGWIMTYLAADIDGDGIVTADEFRRLLRYQRREVLDRLGGQVASRDPSNEAAIAELMKADTDKDGGITLAEMLAAAKANEQQMKVQAGAISPRFFNQVSAFDSSGDGIVSRLEFDTAYESLFRTVDADGDGTISAEELANYRSRLAEPSEAVKREAEEAARRRGAARQVENAERSQREQKRQAVMAERTRKLEEERAACTMPKASSSAKVILVSGYQTDALSNTALGSQDEVIHAGRIMIEPGPEPLYLVVSTHIAAIWQLTGATDRVERLVLATGTTLSKDGSSVPLVGATGLPAEKITMLRGGNCTRYFSEAPSVNAAEASARVTQETGKAVDQLIGRYELGIVSLPSGAVRNDGQPKSALLVITKGAGTLTIQGDTKGIVVQSPSVDSLADDLKRFSPGGVVAIEPASVVSLAPAQLYEVLPQQAGLIQLSQKGSLTRNRSGEFLIHDKIRFPAGLAGAHSVKFLLLKGVPEPDGDPAHSEVVSEETGQQLKKK